MKAAEFMGLLLVDLVLGLQTQPFQGTHPDAPLLRGLMSRSGGFRSSMQRQQTHRSLPLFMMQLYRTMRIEDRAGSAKIRGQQHSRIQDLDCVTSLVAKSCQQVGERWSVTFDLSSMSLRDNIQLAELRIRLPAFTKSPRVLLDIHHSNQNLCSSNNCSENQLGHLEAHPSSMVSSSSWKVFNMTGMLHRWLLQESSTNRTVEIGIKEEQQERIQHPTVDRVMMVVFSRQDSNNQPLLVRTAEQSKYVNLDRRGSRGKRHQETQRDVRFSEEEKQHVLCKKVDMWVDFKKLQWSDWIIHPRRYNAYRCEGSCPTPVDGTLATFNHAHVQSALNHLHPDKVPRLSCAPTHLAPLSMLYYDKRKLVMRHHEDMVVKECGCQ